jgi:rRNA maturation endonuclease Nob1
VTQAPRVWIFDTSALVEAKAALSVADQWQTFKQLEDMVRAGSVAMPRLVIREISEIAHPDLPGAWAPGVRDIQKHPLDAEWGHVQRVMAEAGDVVDPNKTKEDADPYVLALALQLLGEGHDACVVTEDRVDRNRIAVTTACDRLGIAHCSVREFLGNLGIKTKKPAGESADDE